MGIYYKVLKCNDNQFRNGFFDNHIQSRGCIKECSTIFVDCSSESILPRMLVNGLIVLLPQSLSHINLVLKLRPKDNEITEETGSTGGGGGGSITTVIVTNPLVNPPCEINNGSLGIMTSTGNCFFEDEESLRSDCNKLENLSNSQDYQTRMQELITATTGNTEVGYWGFNQDETEMIYHQNNRFESEPDQNEIEFALTSISC